ncbi:MAG: carbohydrate ABC transporter permease [Nitrospirae bacterium]|nr:carbohydrate ABC transporter permease [Nitrospirota bacterium]
MESKHPVSRQKRRKHRDWQKLILWISLTFVSLIFLFPILWMISSSLTPNSEVIQYPPRWIPSHPTLANYIEVFTTARTVRVGRALFNSAFVSVSTVILTLLVASLAAYPLARMEFKGKNALFIFILIGFMVPAQVTFVSLFLIFNSVGWLNTYQALILPAGASPFGVFLLRQFFLAIPKDLEDAARIDGCSRLRILFSIILPLSKPALATLSIFTFLGSWNSFLWPLIVMTDPKSMTVPVILAYYVASFQSSFKWGTLMAVAVVSSLPAVIIFLIFQKQFVRGIALTGLKG